MWQSKAPMPIITSPGRPSFFAHSSLIVPAASDEVYTLLNNLSVNPFSKGSSDEKNSLGGSPFQASLHSVLWPAAHTPRLTPAALLPPLSTKGIQSQCSTHECMAPRT